MMIGKKQVEQNKIIMKILVYLCSFFLIISCLSKAQVTNEKLSKNKKLYNSLYQENGNVFALGSLDFQSSYMWSYGKTGLVVYSLTNGKIQSQKNYSDAKFFDRNWLKSPVQNDDKLDECIAVDASTFLYKVNDVERKFPIQYRCLKENTYPTEFLKGLVQDMNKYEIGWKDR